MILFNKYRQREINIEVGVGSEEGAATFYVLGKNSTMNSFSKENLREFGMQKFISNKIKIEKKTLENILDENSKEFKEIDLLNIDVEGCDYDVLKSNNWRKYRPKVIVVEISCTNLDDIKNSESGQFLLDLNYIIVAKNVMMRNLASVFFVDAGYQY